MSGIKNSLYRTMLYSVIGTALLMAIGVGYFWVRFEWSGFQEESHILRDSYIQSQKNKIKNVVTQVVHYINYQRTRGEEENREQLKALVDGIAVRKQLVVELYQQERGGAKLSMSARNNLKSLLSTHGDDVLFVIDRQGRSKAYNLARVLSVTPVPAADVSLPVTKIIGSVRKNGKGFVSWQVPASGDSAKVKHYLGFAESAGLAGMTIGICEDQAEPERRIQKKILTYINTVRFDRDNYVFAYTFKGVTLAHYLKRLIGVNRWNLRGPNGTLLTQVLIKISKQSGGGYLQYTGTVNPETGKPGIKIGYVASVPDWQWMIGAGVYVDDIDRVLAMQRRTLHRKIVHHALMALVVLTAVLCLVLVLARIVLVRLRGNIDTFTSFFVKAASEAVQMDEDQVHYAEFKRLVAPANRMLQERNKAQEALEESEERLNLAIGATGQGLWDWNLENDTLVWDDRSFAIFGYDRNIGLPSREMIALKAHHQDWIAAKRAMAEHVVGNTDFYRAEYRLLEEDGMVTWVLDQGRITKRDEQGKGLRAVGTYIDITNSKVAENEKNELLEQLNRSKKMEALGLLAGGVAHDLNNVLSGIVSYPDLLLESLPEDSNLLQPLTIIRNSGNKAAAIVQDLLTLARRGVVTYDVVNLNRIIREYLDAPEYDRLMAQFPTTRVETRLEPALLNIKGSMVHIRKSLLNLVSNAFEAQPNNGRVVISTDNRYLEDAVTGYETILPGEYAVLTVEDFGTGIADNEIQRIFEPFYTRKILGRHNGTGLGMAIVWGTVRDHHGFIDVKSKEGEGTHFELYFPVTREKPVAEEVKVSIDALVATGEHILVIDDVPEQRRIAESLLEKLGYRVSVVESGEAAVEFLRSESVDLLLLDMIMDPGMDGLDTYRRIIELHPGQRALITSGYTETNRVKEAQRLGAGQYLRKPFTFKGLAIAVRLELKASRV